MLDGVVAVALALSVVLAVEAVVPGVVADARPWVRCWAAVYCADASKWWRDTADMVGLMGAAVEVVETILMPLDSALEVTLSVAVTVSELDLRSS